MTDKELRTLDEILTNLEIWSSWSQTFANEMIGLGAKIRNLLADRKTESDSEKPNNCELQTIRCPKCGRTDYIRDMEKDMGIKGSHYKYKCINCNTYIKDEPTISKMEQVDKDINVRSKTEPQTERSE